MKRLISLCATMAIALGLSAAVAPADATVGHPATVQHSQSARALPARPITMSWKQVGTSIKVRLKGKAQDLANGRIYLQEKRSGDWKRIDRAKTDDATRYHFVTKVPKDGHHHKYRVMTPKGGGYKKSYSQIVELYWT